MTETDDVVVARVPPRWRPYVVIAAGILLHFTYGIVYTFGNLLPYLVSYLRWKVDPTLSGGSLIWIQSLMGIDESVLGEGVDCREWHRNYYLVI